MRELARNKMLRSIGTSAGAILLFACAGSAHASGSISGTIASVAGDYNNGMLVRLAGSFSNPDNCTRTDWYILPDNNAHAQLLQAILLSAQASNRAVGVQIEGCQDNFPRIIAVWN